MLSIKSAVVTALQSATALSTMTGIYPNYPPNFISLPSVSYFEIANNVSLSADNQEIAAGITYQIDLWGKSSLTAYAQAVDSIMTGLEFARVACEDLYETDTKIIHKAMRYRVDYSDPNF
jgi:hypothetical protein